MAYSSKQDVQNAAGGSAALLALADFDGTSTGGTLDAAGLANVDDAIATGDGVIDSYLGKRFAVPIAAPPPMIVKLSARFAVFELRSGRQVLTAADMERHEADTEWLAAVAAGTVMPGVDPLPGKSSIEIDQAGARPSSKLVSRNRLKGFW